MEGTYENTVLVCHDLMQNHLLTYRCTNIFILNQIFSFFPIVKMAGNYAEIGRVGKLDAGFQQVPFVQIF